MCISAILAGVGVAASVGSSVASGVMNYNSAKAQAEAAKRQAEAQASLYRYEARMEDINADLARKQKQDTLETGRRGEQDIVYKAGTVANTQDVAVAGQGFVVNEGTGKDIKTDTYLKSAIDTSIMRENTNKQAWGFEVQAQNYERSARYKRMAANKTLTAGMINADASWDNFGAGLVKSGADLVGDISRVEWS